MAITDFEVDELIQPIINLYNQMEYDLIYEIAQRFENYDGVAGSLDWQLHKLDELGGLNQQAVKIISDVSKKSEKEIRKLLNEAGYMNLDKEALQQAYTAGAIKVNPLKLLETPALAATINQSYKELSKTFKLIQTKALESTSQAYMNVLNTVYLDVASGVYDYNSSIKKALKEMAKKGIDGATYKRGNTIVKYSIEGTVRRDALTAVHQTANRVALQSCAEMGAEYVEISSHLGARVHPTNPIANHAGWQGKVFKIEGKTKKYPNLKESTGYPDDILGLGGVNCRHRMFPFFPGISTPNPIQYDEKENERIYNLTQEQRKMERGIRYLKKQKAAAEAIGDEDATALFEMQLQEKYEEIENFCNENGLKRDHARELVTEQIGGKPKELPLNMQKDGKKYDMTTVSTSDRSMYQRYKSVLGESSPKTLEEFVNIKYNDKDRWDYLQGLNRYLNKHSDSDESYYQIKLELTKLNLQKIGTPLKPRDIQAFILPSGKRDSYHVMRRMNERHITDDEVRLFVKNAKCMFSQWGGRRLAFYGNEGVSVVSVIENDFIFKTVWSKTDFDETTEEILKVVNKYVK